MILQLLQTGAAERVAQKAAHIMEVDPHGFTLTIVSVSVVFGSLFLLFVAYSITGRLFTGKSLIFKLIDKCRRRAGNDTEQAAAIAVALDLYMGGGKDEEEAAAIATALHCYLDSDAVHDVESGIITIKR